jgi:hypothetical protein
VALVGRNYGLWYGYRAPATAVPTAPRNGTAYSVREEWFRSYLSLEEEDIAQALELATANLAEEVYEISAA